MIGVLVNGGLGNQMWGYAHGRALALKFNTELKLDLSHYFPGKRPLALQYYNIHAGFLTDEDMAKLKVIREDHTISDACQQIDEDDVYLIGGWMTPACFSSAQDAIREDLRLRVYLRDDTKRILDEIHHAKVPVSMHVRRGDYFDDKWGHIYVNLPLTYYQEAVRRLQERYGDIEMFVFSNDMAWCRESLELDVPVHYVDCNDEAHGFEDLHLMSQCQHHIIANSTFSWWGAWLGVNKEKSVIAPDRYIDTEKDIVKKRVEYPYYKAFNRDWLPEDWEKIRV